MGAPAQHGARLRRLARHGRSAYGGSGIRTDAGTPPAPETAHFYQTRNCSVDGRGRRADGIERTSSFHLRHAHWASIRNRLRPAEALALDRTDVDLENGVLSIRQTKFGKSRFVPVSESTRAALVLYAKKRNEIWPQGRSEAFFISSRGERLLGSTVRRTFVRISCNIGLRAPSGKRRSGHGPRLQDFRHSFATRRLIEWYRGDLDVGQELPKLATYLGHVDVHHTYWYIEAVPELLQLATERLGGCQRGHRPRGEQ
jgi:Phage integrase family